MKTWLLIPVLVLLIAGRASCSEAGSETDKAGVYQALFKGCGLAKAEALTFVFVNSKEEKYSTHPFGAEDMKAFIKRDFPRAQASTMADFARQKLVEPISASRDIGVKHVIIDKQTMPNLFEERDGRIDWTKFQKSYPDGVATSVSGIGFNAERSQALVFVFFARSGSEPEFYVFLLEKKGGKWMVAKRQLWEFS